MLKKHSIKSIVILVLLGHFTLAQTFELDGSDTVNYVDGNGMKQKHWLIKNDSRKLESYSPTQLVEEGDYQDNNKNGLWVMYYPNDQVKHELTFKNNRAYGPAKFYYKNGKISEEGFWKFTKWDGEYKTFYENGKPQYEWNYKNGQKQGNQVWYHENGQKMYEGSYQSGREDGVQQEWDENGNLVAERVFNNGKMDTVATKFHIAPVVAKHEAPKDNTEEHEVVPTGGKPHSNFKGVFTGNGYHKLYDNDTKQLIKDGLFKNGKLIDGWVYEYDNASATNCTTKYELKSRKQIKSASCTESDGGIK